MAPTVILVTGGNRGLGQGLVKKFLAQPNHTVIAAALDPAHETALALAELPKGQSTSLIVVKYDAAVEKSASDLVQELDRGHGIKHLDIVVANAGIVKGYPLVKDATRAQMEEHMAVNAWGVVALYQATRPLLEKSTNKPIFAPMGSGAGALGRQPPVPNAIYGPTKAVVAWYGVRINVEDEWLNTFVLDPGFVQTEMGNTAAHTLGLEEAPVTVEESTAGLFSVLTTATKEKYGGKVVFYTGKVQVY